MSAYLRFALLIRKELYGAIFGIFMSFIATFASVALMGTATWFLSAMAVAGFYDYALNIFIPSALIRLLALARTLLRYGERYYTHGATFKLLADRRVFLFERAVDLKIEEAMRLKSSDLQRRLQADLERLEMIYVRQFVPFVCAVLMGMVVGGVLLSFSFLMAFTALALMVLAGVIVPLFLTRIAERYSTEQSTLAIELNDQVSDLIGGFFDLMLLGKHLERARLFLEKAQALAKARATIIFYDQLSQVVLLSLSELTLLLLLIQSVPLVVLNQMSPPQMMMLAVSAMASFEVLVPLSAACLNLPYVMHSAQRVSDLLHITEQNADIDPKSEQLLRREELNSRTFVPTDMAATDEQSAAAYAAGAASKLSGSTKKGDTQAAAKSASEAAARATAGGASAHSAAVSVVRLEQVSFAYDLGGETQKPVQQLSVLENCNLSFSSDQNYVLKAPSGRGKSTLVWLLTRLLEPKSGELFYNDQPYSSLSPREIRAHFAVSMQDITLFSGSIYSVFKQVRPDITTEEVMDALNMVELTDLIVALPQGLNEWLGSTGLALSGGQARRLCLARALVAAKNSDFVLLDEPGEGLDEAQEVRILERIQNWRKGVIIITHKQAGLALADKVINF